MGTDISWGVKHVTAVFLPRGISCSLSISKPKESEALYGPLGPNNDFTLPLPYSLSRFFIINCWPIANTYQIYHLKYGLNSNSNFTDVR